MNDYFNNLFIFEMANNHQGSVEHGLKIIDAMGKIAREKKIKGAMKFQYRDIDTFIHPDYRNRDDVKHIPRFLSTRLTDKQYLKLIESVRDNGMIPICTPFDEISVQKCLDHDIEILKVASCSANDWPLLEVIAAANKPIIVSTGGQQIQEIDNIVTYLTHRNADFAVMHCVGIYPAPNEKLSMDFISKLIRRYSKVPIGYSGHEAPDNLDVVKVAVSKGAIILERHVGVPTDQITLNKYSMNPEQVEAWVMSALLTMQICGGRINKSITESEVDSLQSLKRGVYAARNIQKGELVKREDTFFAMPSMDGQTTSGEFGRYRTTFTASKNYKRNESIHEHSEPDIFNTTRGIIHEFKGMIYEAHIELGRDPEIELSHHYGMEHFRETGALIINIINREYCKKLIALLHGQQHPNHFHKQKEETFQLLWGDLTINLDGRTIKMNPGDKLLVEREVQHSFASEKGAIFEEVSTTHVKGDSYYEDTSISSLDPIQRKTIIEEW